MNPVSFHVWQLFVVLEVELLEFLSRYFSIYAINNTLERILPTVKVVSTVLTSLHRESVFPRLVSLIAERVSGPLASKSCQTAKGLRRLERSKTGLSRSRMSLALIYLSIKFLLCEAMN